MYLIPKDPIPPGELGGAIAINIFAILSTIGLVSVALRTTWLLRRNLLLTAPEIRERVFFKTQLGQYAACLFIATVFSTTSGIIGISWVAQQGIREGWVCRFQATLMHIATWGTAYFTVAIAVHTFNSLVLRRRQSVILCRSTMSIGWIIAILAGLIPFMIHRPDGYVYGADGLTCGVRSIYPKLQFLFHLLPILIGSLLSAILYSLIFLALRGTLKIRGGIKLTLNPDDRWNNCEDLGENYHRFIARIATSVLWFPVAYVAFLVPYSIVRMLDISGFVVPFGATVFGSACWFSLGIVDVLLLYNAFRVRSPAFDALSTSAGTGKSMHITGRHQNIEHLAPLAPLEKISQYCNADSPPRLRRDPTMKSSAFDFVEWHLDQREAKHIESRTNLSLPSVGRSVTSAFYHNNIITPPPPAALFLRSDIERYDRENSPILAAGLPAPPRQPRSPITAPSELELPQSLGLYDNFTSGNDQVILRQQSAQTFGHQDSSRSRTPSWTSD